MSKITPPTPLHSRPIKISERLYELLRKQAKSLGYPHTITSICNDAIEHAIDCAEWMKGRN